MSDVIARFDNTLGHPIFQPELTGGGLQGQALNDWISFCTAVVANDEPTYNTWFENKWLRASESAGGQGKERSKCVVRATEVNGMIVIRCPTKFWAEQLRDKMSSLRGLSARKFWVLAPNENPPKQFDPAKLRSDIAEWERLVMDPNTTLGPAHFKRMISMGRATLEKYEKRQAA